MRRFGAWAFGAVIAAAAVLAVLGYVSLRQWETSAELLFREQARAMAVMAAEKVEMAILKSEEECLATLQLVVANPAFRPEALDAWMAKTPLFDRVYLFDRQGRLLYPEGRAADAGAVAGLPAEISPGFWDRGGRRHLVVGGQVVLAAVLAGSGDRRLLAALGRSEAVLRRDVIEKALGEVPAQSVLAVLDGESRPVYASRPLGDAERLSVVSIGDALPSWRIALYQPAGASRVGTRQQTLVFTATFALLLGVIVAGLAATYRVVRRETEMARLKSDFVANVSHDLKTPLSLIRMFAETLELGRVPDEATRRQYYGVITRESERLTRLIDNVLDFSRIEGGRQRYDVEAHAIEPVIHEVTEAFRYSLAQQGFKLDLDVDPDLPDVLVDAPAVKQALANLVDNAMKYSADRRQIGLRVRSDGGFVHVDVTDQGIGIPPAEIPRIFEKFYRIGRSETQERRGSGVGLALVKHIAEAHGGRVSVESQAGAGSRFTLSLPVAREG
jgi:signal transduction histidine kinase